LIPTVGLMAADGVWTAGGGSWTNTANWAGGIVAGDGGTATFTGPTSQNTFTVTVPAGLPFTLSGLIFNPTNAVTPWAFNGETNTLVAPARFEINRENVFFRGQLTGSDGLHFVGRSEHSLALETTNFFTGTVTAENGRLLPRFDESLGAVPPVLIPDAVVVSNATLGNYGAPGVDIHANRGITAVENAYFHGRDGGSTGYLRIHSPITGAGNVWILRQNSFMEFLNPASDYAGDTVFGGTKIGYYSGAPAAALLRLGADEVLPHGPGKGRLLFGQGMNGTLDLQGHAETVNAIGSPDDGDFTLTNSLPAPGVLMAGLDDADMRINGTVRPGVTLEKIGAGTLRFADRFTALDPSRGTLKLSEGALAFTDPAFIGPLTLLLDGGALRHAGTQPGLVEYGGASSGSINFAEPLRFCGVRLSPRTGDRGYIGYPNNTQYRYVGQWHVPAGGTYSFAQSFDDRSYLAIDGVEILTATNTAALAVKRNVALAAGWHDIEIRLAQGGGGVGPRTNVMDAAVMYDPGNGDFSSPANARRFQDPGDGSVLRTKPLAAADTVTAAARAEIAADTALDRSGTEAPLVWAGDLVSVTPGAKLTVTGHAAEPFRVGSTNRPAVFAADVADANGVVFQDKAWLLAFPASSSWSIAAGADIAAGAPGLFTGDQTLAAYSLRIPSAAPLGTGTETVTVGGGNLAVTFDATREENARLVDDPAYAFTVSNAVVLASADARVAFDGAGTVTYAGAVSGSGTLVKNGSGTAVLAAASTFAGGVAVNAGRLVVADDAQLGDPANAVALNGGVLDLAFGGTFARDLSAADGGLAVAAPNTLTATGTLSGTLTKRGGGVLAVEGPSPALDLYVAEGVAVLASSSGPAVRHILGVDTAAVARVAADGGDQISGSVTLTGGMLDLAGRAESVGALLSGNDRSCVTNGAVAPVVLTVGEGNANGTYVGGLSGDLSLVKTGTGWLATAGAPGTQNAAGALAVDGGEFAFGLGIRQIRFMPVRTRTPGRNPNLSEFQITRRGKVVPWPVGTATTGTTSTSGNESWRLIDDDTRKAWQANAAIGQYVTVHLPAPVVFDGYRWYTGSTVVNDSAGDPVAWEIYVSTDGNAFYLADARDLAASVIPTRRGVKAGDWTLTRGPASAFAPSFASVASGAVFRVQLADAAVGALSGIGALDLKPGARLAVGDLSAFTGSVSGKGATLALGAETPLTLPVVSSAGVTALNGSSAPASAVVGARGEPAFFGALKDGPAAPLGLVKRGPGDLRLADAGSAYTGDTVVESGALVVEAGTFSFRYVRFNVTAALDPGTDSAGFEMAYGEFQLLRGGALVSWPVGTVANPGYVKGDKNHGDDVPGRAIDGNLDNRWLSQPLQALVVDTKSSVTFDGYRYYTSKVNNQDRSRAPVAWTVDGSDDGVTWVTINIQSGVVIPPAVGVAHLIGPHNLGFSTLELLPAALRAETPPTNHFLSGVAARYLRFTVTQIRGEDTANYDGFQFAELSLFKDGAVVPWPVGTLATAPGGYWAADGTPTPAKVVNNTANNEAADRWLCDSVLNPLTVELPVPATFDAYGFTTAYNNDSQTHRTPVGWRLEISADSNTWYVVDERWNEATPTASLALAGPYPLRLPAGGAALDAIPDASRVVVHAGAALRIGGDAFETVGPLNGAGTVSIAEGATLTLNLFEDAVFDGAFGGAGGTLALAGNHAFTCTGAAATPGDFAVDFRGGKFGGTLHVGGALAVSGPVAYALPASLPASVPLFTFGSIDAASRDALVAGAASLAVPQGYAANVRVTGNAATLTVSAPGLIMMLR
jgi:autotransporter-associated beta strand protein